MSNADPAIIVIKDARLSYSAIFTPRKGKSDNGKDDKEPRYSASLILDKETQKDMIKAVRQVIKHVAGEKWKDKSVINKPDLKVITGDGTTNKLMILGQCMHDGAEKADKDGYGDHVVYVTASRGIKDSKGTELPPLPVVDKKGQAVDPKSGLIYDGCRVHASVRVWAQDNDFGKRLNCELRAIAFSRDDTPFGSGPIKAKDEFGDLIEDEFGDDDEAPAKPVTKKAAVSDIDDDL